MQEVCLPRIDSSMGTIERSIKRLAVTVLMAVVVLSMAAAAAAGRHNETATESASVSVVPVDLRQNTTLNLEDDRPLNLSGSAAADGSQLQESDFDTDGIARRVAPFTAGRWYYAHATFYGDESAQETMQGACGYQNLWEQGYGAATTALSTTLFNHGFACGSCFEIRCVGSWACYPGNPSTKVTATNFCPANWAKPTDNGGWCNPPRQHFDMAKPAFEKIAYWRAGIVPVQYRRVACTKKGNMEFLIEGNRWWHIVFITNVGGPGDVGQVFVRGSKTRAWMSMTHNWGAGYQIFGNFLGESLSFMVISNSNFETVVSWNMVPSNWQLGQTFTGGQFQSSS